MKFPRLKLPTIVGFSCFIVAGLAIAADPVAEINPKKLPKCCVWRVTNAKAPFYLVGTIHALSKSDYPLPSPYELALNDSQKLIFEYDPNKDDAFQKKFIDAAKYPKGQDLRSKVQAGTLNWLRNNTQVISYDYNKAEKKYHRVVKSFDSALQYRPWFIADQFFDVRSYSDVSHKHGVDSYLEEKARKTGKELGGIETIEEHVAVLGKMSDIDSEILLLDTLVYWDTSDNEFWRTRSAWRRGDVEKMWTLDSRLRRESPMAAARLVDYRNIMWIPRIEREIHSGKPTSLVVGALHFAGPNSVITLLQKRGYTIEQL